MIHLPQNKLKRHELYEIIISVLASRRVFMQDKKEVGSFPSLPPPETVIKLIKMTQDIFQKESSLLRLNFSEPKDIDGKPPADDTYIVVGDLHGNIDDLLRIFEDNSYPPDTKYIFTGDYVDRGSCSVEIMLLLFSLKSLYPDHVFLLRGNHESQDICSVYGFQYECELKFPNTAFVNHNVASKSSNNDDNTSHPSSTLISLSPTLMKEDEENNNIQTNSTEKDEAINQNNNNDSENHLRDDGHTTFFDLEINLNSISLPSFFSTPTTTNPTNGNSEATNADIESDYFNFESYHYFNNYNDNSESYNNADNNNDALGSDSMFYTEPTNISYNKIFKAFTDAFTYMPFAAVVADQIFCVHGGISPDIQYLEQIEDVKRPCLASDDLVTNGILWSDPRNNLPMGLGTGNGFEPSDRGTGYLFNDFRLNQFLKNNNLTHLIRSHEPCEEGYNKPFGENGRCITVFSNSDYCGMDNTAAVAKLTPLNIDESNEPDPTTSSFISSSSSSLISEPESRSESPDSVNPIKDVAFNENQNNNIDNEKNHEMRINVETFNNHDNNNDNMINNNNNTYNPYHYKNNDDDNNYVKESVLISFRLYEPLTVKDLKMRRIIFPDWILTNTEPFSKHPANLKENFHDGDFLNSIIDDPVDLFYTGI